MVDADTAFFRNVLSVLEIPEVQQFGTLFMPDRIVQKTEWLSTLLDTNSVSLNIIFLFRIRKLNAKLEYISAHPTTQIYDTI
jgi:hypothetical protein